MILRSSLRAAASLLMFALAASAAEAQARPATGGLAGRVLDAADGEGLPMVTLALFRREGAAEPAFATGTTTALDGSFRLEGVPAGTYDVRVSFVGYETQTLGRLEIRAGQVRDLGTIRLAVTAQALEAAEIVAERPAVEQRADRTVYNVAEQPVTTGGSALDALETIPSVDVDADGGVSLRGSQNVAVYVNGRPTPVTGPLLAAFLRSIPSDQIERIEVIPNPSARFDPDGMSGIVNIVLREAPPRGRAGGLTLGGETAPGGELGANLSLREGPWEAALRYGFRAHTRNPLEAQRQQSALPGGLAFEQDGRGDHFNTNHRLGATLGYALRPGTTLGLDAGLAFRRDRRDNVSQTLLFPGTGDEQARLRQTDGTRRGLNTDAALTLRHRFGDDHDLQAELRATRNTRDEEFLFADFVGTDRAGLATAAPAGREQSRSDERADEAYAQLDYTRALGGGLRLETGGKLTAQRLGTDVEFAREAEGVFVPVPARTSDFVYDETVGAAYVQAARPFGALDVQFGLRAESASRAFALGEAGERFPFTYASLFPSAFAVYTLAPGTLVKAGYSRRINRPRTRQLNPFPSFVDTLNVRVGNPDLRPEYTDALEATLQYRYALSVTPFYRRTTDVIRQRFTLDEGTGVSTFSFQNLDTQDSYGLDVTLTPLLGPRLRGLVSGSLFRTVTDGGSAEAGLANDALTWTLRGNVTARLREGTDLQVFGFYRGAQRVEDGRVGAFGFSTIGLRQALSPQLALSMRLNDPFGTRQFTFERADGRFFVFGTRSPNDRRLTATLTYTFGQSERRDRDRDRDDNGGEDDGFGF
ncbi:MAG: TonB-dependent receptor domain-containing protein [Rubricoccaceae bacterium]